MLVSAATTGLSVTGNVGSYVAGSGGAGMIITGSTDAITLTPGSGHAVDYNGTDLITAIVDGVFFSENTVEEGYTLQGLLSLVVSACCGMSTLVGDIRTYRDVNNTINRIVATTDTNGQRVTVTLDPAG